MKLNTNKILKLYKSLKQASLIAYQLNSEIAKKSKNEIVAFEETYYATSTAISELLNEIYRLPNDAGKKVLECLQKTLDV